MSKLLACKSTPIILQVMALCFDDPILSAMATDFHFDTNYVYFHEDRFQDKKVMEQLISEGKMFREADFEAAGIKITA